MQKHINNFVDDLGALSDPKCFNAAIELGGADTTRLIHFYRDMVTVRSVEERIAKLSSSGEIITPVHLGVGQEAIAVGVSACLSHKDKVYSGHRGHSHYLALHASLDGLFAELLGRATGVCSGMGGSMHLYAPEVGFHGSVPIVGATIPIAVGAALACKMDGDGCVAIAYFGDGACEEGVLHESMNLAKAMNLPIIFVCENNFYSSHLDIHLRQPSNSVARFAEAHRISHHTVDGNDVLAVEKAAGSLIEDARSGLGPSFLEAITFRWLGHVGPNDDIDVGVRRSPEELADWKGRDPIRRLADALLTERDITNDTLVGIKTDVEHAIESAVNFAKNSDFPEEQTLLEYVYAGERL